MRKPIDVVCTQCGAQPGQRCVSLQGFNVARAWGFERLADGRPGRYCAPEIKSFHEDRKLTAQRYNRDAAAQAAAPPVEYKPLRVVE